MPTKPTLTTLNTKFDLLMERINETNARNDMSHQDIMEKLSSNEQKFNSLFQNGPITGLQKEMVRLEDKVDKVGSDLINFKGIVYWALSAIGVVVGAAASWAIVQFMTHIFGGV